MARRADMTEMQVILMHPRYQPCDNERENKAAKDVAWIMEAKVHTGIAYQNSCQHHDKGQQPVTEPVYHEQRQQPDIGGMGRGEAATSTMPPMHHVHKMGYRVIWIAGTKASYIRA